MKGNETANEINLVFHRSRSFDGLVATFFLQAKIENSFENYLEKSNIGFINNVKSFLEDYYATNGSFAGLQEVLTDGQNSYNSRDGAMGRGRGKMMAGRE